MFKFIFLITLLSFNEMAFSSELFKGENLLVKPADSDEYQTYVKEEVGLKSNAWVSKTHEWKDTYTVNILRGKYEDLEHFREIQDKPGKDACSKFESLDIDRSKRNGYEALFWETHCEINKNKIIVIQLAISGRDSLYHVRKLWKIPVSDDEFFTWKQQMSEISVCDTRKKRKKEHPCPTGLKKVDKS